MDTIREVLMRRDKISGPHADALIDDARTALYEYITHGDMQSAEDVCAEYFGLEPDYVLGLI